MILRQFLHTDPVISASYILACAGKGLSVAVDPVDDPDTYLAAAAGMGTQIRYVVDTHVHADHVSGGRRLAEKAGARYVLHSTAGALYPFEAVDDGDVLEAGNVSLQVIHTPGHTPEHISLLVTDRSRGPEPWMVLTGHTLMVGDMGRTELATDVESGARSLFESAERLRQLADHILVLPGAFAGSVCGRALSGSPTSTIGFERRFNRAFRIEDRDSFIQTMTREIPPRPLMAEQIRAYNLGALAEAPQ